MAHRILIVGGGFAGVTAARSLARERLHDTEITLVTDKPWLEYYGVLYRLIRGESPSQACLPLAMIVPPTVRVVVDAAVSIDAVERTVHTQSGQQYAYDTLVLAVGSEPSYFGIPGMQEHAVCMNGVHTALALRAQIEHHARQGGGRFLIIGGGATGVEIAGEVLPMVRAAASAVGGDPGAMQVDLIEAKDRLLSQLDPTVSARVLRRLQALGVHVMLATGVASAEAGAVRLKDGTVLPAAMIIWTAGVQANALLGTVQGMQRDPRGRAVVDAHLRAQGVQGIYALGDVAGTPYSGMAQTAYADGRFVAAAIAAERRGKSLPVYRPRVPAYAIPAGRGWAAVRVSFVRAYGIPGYILRRAADIHVYMLFLRWRFVRAAFFGSLPLEKYGISLVPEVPPQR